MTTDSNSNETRGGFEAYVYLNRSQAEDIIARLQRLGYGHNDISVMGSGAVAEGIIGTLVGAGIPEERAKQYESEINRGGILIGVHPREEHRHQVRRILRADDDEIVPRRSVW